MGTGKAAKAISGCWFARPSKYFGNCLTDDVPNMAYVISDCGFQFRQNGVQFTLILGGDSPISEQTNTIFKAGRWHGKGGANNFKQIT